MTVENLTEQWTKSEKASEDSYASTKQFHQVPGPTGFPVIGTLLDYFKKDGLKFSKMFEAYRQRSLQFGPIFKEKIGPIETVVVSDPDEYAKVIRSEGRHPVRRQMEPMVFYREQRDLEPGLVNSQGEHWHHLRSAVSKHMLKLQTINRFSSPVNSVAKDFVRRIHEIKDSENEVAGIETEVFNYFRHMQPLMYNLPFYKLFRTKRWIDYETHSDEVMRIGRQLFDQRISSLTPGEGVSPSSFLGQLFFNENLSATEVTGTAVDLLMAAVETTSNALLWCLYCLANNMDVQERLFQEVDSVFQLEENLSQESLTQMPLIRAVLKETFRLYPITYATSRILPRDLEVGGYNIPAGTHIQANLYGMFRDASYFPDPESFKPERWLRGNMDSNLQSLSNLIWGHGPRMCIGRRFAEMELHILLAKLIHSFKLSYTGDAVEPVLNTVMTPDRPLQISFSPR
ncbi:hypothetical protein C0Q70_16660 [Pomacea canaliculata]|uniref:Cytochrome P450 n=1 Tax=Pomacea canaliculata TaxID=400727 RepID=A0A2T7NQE3_POMCA|nr:hypothetical protein C0Q70_16660 [Pomacea canaliculata]